MQEQNSNIRIRFTKDTIKKTLTALVRTKSISSVTVHQLCRQAAISRTTFYRHYKDIYDVVEECEDDMIRSLQEIILCSKNQSPEEILSIVFSNMKENPESYLPMVMIDNDRINSKILHMCKKQLEESIKKKYGVSDSEKTDIILSYIIGGVNSAIAEWIKGDFALSPEEMTRITAKMLN